MLSLSERLVEKLPLEKIRGNPKAKQLVCQFFENAVPGSILLLHGPPGTGKTQLVQAAAEAHDVIVHTQKMMEKDDKSILEQVKDRMLDSKQRRMDEGMKAMVARKEAIVLDPFEEVSQDAKTTREFCKLFTREKILKKGRMVVIVLNDVYAKAYYPIRSGKKGSSEKTTMADLLTEVRMYPLRGQDVQQILMDHGMTLGSLVKKGMDAAQGDGRKAVIYAHDQISGAGKKDKKVDVFTALTAALNGDCAGAMECVDARRLEAMVRVNLPKMMPSSFDNGQQVGHLSDLCSYYDSLCLSDVSQRNLHLPHALHESATHNTLFMAGQAMRADPRHRKNFFQGIITQPFESYMKEQKRKEIRHMNSHFCNAEEMNLYMKVIDSQVCHSCRECNEKMTVHMLLGEIVNKVVALSGENDIECGSHVEEGANAFFDDIDDEPLALPKHQSDSERKKESSHIGILAVPPACSHSLRRLEKALKKMSREYEETGVNPLRATETLHRFDMRKFLSITDEPPKKARYY